MRRLGGLVAIAFLACSGADGAAGPPGAAGLPGPAGSAGPPGPGSDGGVPDSGVPELILEGDYAIENSLDVAMLRPYTKITGSVVVGGAVATVALPNLREVGGDLVASPNIPGRPQTDTIDTLDLPALTRVGGAFFVLGRVLTNAPALKSAGALTLVGAQTTIVHMGALATVGPATGGSLLYEGVNIGDGNPAPAACVKPIPLTALTTVNGSLNIRCQALPTLAGLENLRTVTDLRLSGPLLTDVSALANVTTESLTVTGTGLSSLGAMAGVTHGSLQVYGNVAMPTVGLPNLASSTSIIIGDSHLETSTTMLAFPKLKTMTSNLLIQNQSLLTTLSFPTLTTVSGTFTIQNNAALKQCTADALRAQITTGPSATTMSGNTGAGTCP